MPVIDITTMINAPMDRVFDLSRSIDLHTVSTAHTGERAVGDFQSPLGFLGRIADSFFLKRYMRRLLVTRNAAIKNAAETDKWRRYL